jgi:hypothetical protein
MYRRNKEWQQQWRSMKRSDIIVNILITVSVRWHRYWVCPEIPSRSIGKDKLFPGIVSPEDLAFLHLCGKARSYLGYGVYNTTITWEKGERFPTENILPGTDFGNIEDEQMSLMMYWINGYRFSFLKYGY